MSGERHRTFRLVRLPIPGPRWPLDEMDVGESFLERDMNKWGAIRTACTKAKNRSIEVGLPRGFTVRRTFEGIRVHRVE